MQETIVAKDQKTISNEMQCLLLKVRLSTKFSLRYVNRKVLISSFKLIIFR